MTEQEMMADLQAADSAGDTQLAQHIAQQIKAARQPQHGAFAEAVHKTAAHFPMAGAVLGGGLGAAAGGGLGSILTGAAGAGLGGGAGKALQRFTDSALGYDQPSIMDATKDALKSAGGEALGAGVGGAAGELIGAAARPLSPLLRKFATSTTARILRNTGGSLSAAKPLSQDAAQEVLDMGIIKPFGTSAGAAGRLSAAREASGSEYSRIVKALEAQGITGPQADQLAMEYAGKAATARANSMNASVPAAYQGAADMTAVKPVDASGRLGLEQAENMKRSLQDQATSAYKQLQPGELARAHEDTASTMRQAVEDAIAKQSAPMVVSPEVKGLASQFEPVKQQTGRLIEADNIAQAGMARAANRHAISPADLAAFVGEQAHSGNPVRGAGAALLMHLARTRGPSTFAASTNSMANALEDPASNILARLGAGGGAAAGPKLLELLAQMKRNRSEAASVP